MNKNILKQIIAAAAVTIVTLSASFIGTTGGVTLSVVQAADWKAEFNDICGKTEDAMSLSAEALKQLIARCDKLRLVMESLEASEKKVYLKRLKMCQDMFVFALESKDKQQ